MDFSKWVDGRRQGRKAWRQVEGKLGEGSKGGGRPREGEQEGSM